MDTIQVSNIKCTTGDSSMNPDLGQSPASSTVTMCLRAWNVDQVRLRPLSTPSATGSRNMLIPDSCRGLLMRSRRFQASESVTQTEAAQ